DGETGDPVVPAAGVDVFADDPEGAVVDGVDADVVVVAPAAAAVDVGEFELGERCHGSGGVGGDAPGGIDGDALGGGTGADDHGDFAEVVGVDGGEEGVEPRAAVDVAGLDE